MKTIEFRAGYYEWLILINNKLVATTGYPESDNKQLTKKDIECFADDLIDDLKDVAKNYDLSCGDKYYFIDNKCASTFRELKNESIKRLKQLMLSAWRYLYE